MEAKHEANRTKEETERQAELEREVCNNYSFSHNTQVKDVLALQDRKYPACLFAIGTPFLLQNLVEDLTWRRI